MDNMGSITAVIAGLLSVIAVLIVVIRWTLEGKRNGNSKGSAEQSRQCALDHQQVLSKIEAVQKSCDLIQNTVDSRIREVFDVINDMKNILN